MTCWLTKACTHSIICGGLSAVQLWFRKPNYQPRTRCPLEPMLTYGGYWGTDGPGPASISCYHLRDTPVGAFIWRKVLESERITSFHAMRYKTVHPRSNKHHKRWRLEIEVDLNAIVPAPR